MLRRNQQLTAIRQSKLERRIRIVVFQIFSRFLLAKKFCVILRNLWFPCGFVMPSHPHDVVMNVNVIHLARIRDFFDFCYCYGILLGVEEY